jgi:hypothetical protein
MGNFINKKGEKDHIFLPKIRELFIVLSVHKNVNLLAIPRSLPLIMFWSLL